MRISKSARHVLSAASVKALSKKGAPCFKSDGGGLFFRIKQSGAQGWVFRYTIDGKQTWMGIGPYVDVSLAQAREQAATYRQQRRQGIDPLANKRAQLAAQRRVDEQQRTFKDIATDYIAARQDSWSKKHAAQWSATLETYAYPTLGKRYVSDIAIDHVVTILKPIWHSKGETARRVRGRIETVLDEAIALELIDGENPAKLGPRLRKLLQDDKAKAKPVHLAALPYSEIHDFILTLREKPEISRLALEFTILTACRTGEVIGARWDEIAGDVWTIPGERMKNGFPHRVPLSTAAQAVLKQLPNLGHGWLFPGHKTGSHISNMAMLTMLKKRMGRTDITVHGFRSTFRDWIADQTNVANEVAERAIAHSLSDKTEAAYRRNDMLRRRHKLMESWAQYIDTKPGDVVQIGAQA